MWKSRNRSAWEPNRDGWHATWRELRARFKSVTQLIIWLCIGLFLLQLLGHLARTSVVENLLGLSASGLKRGFVWHPVTYMFLHADLWHILFNLLVLWFLGREVEYFIGPKPFTALYLLSGVIGSLLWLSLNSGNLLIGASAGVLGCVIAFATLFPERELTLLLFFVLPVKIKAKYLAIGVVVLEIIFELSNTRSGVAHLAHLGGAATGYVFIKALGYGTNPRWVLWFQRVGERLRGKRQSPRARRGSQSVEDYLREEIDPILDKISREGMHSLTKQERKILESARDLMEKHRR